MSFDYQSHAFHDARGVVTNPGHVVLAPTGEQLPVAATVHYDGQDYLVFETALEGSLVFHRAGRCVRIK